MHASAVIWTLMSAAFMVAAGVCGQDGRAVSFGMFLLFAVVCGAMAIYVSADDEP